jgi:hypothetical protein
MYAALISSLTFRSLGSNPLASVKAQRTALRSQVSRRNSENCVWGVSENALNTIRLRA